MNTEVSGGHRCTFVDEIPEHLLCVLCNFPSRDPQLSTCCGYNTCQNCLRDYKHSVQTKSATPITWFACPKCCRYDFNAYPNKMSNREIHNLLVLCTNTKVGCKWRGKLNQLKGHLESSNGCQFEMVECPRGCKVSASRSLIGYHVKSVCGKLVINCPHCLVRGEKHFIEGKHLEECSKLPVTCPNCDANISNKNLTEHKGVCPLEIITCNYGCNICMTRKDAEVHDRENVVLHLSVAKQKLCNSTKELESSKEVLAKVEGTLDTLKSNFARDITEVLSMIRLLAEQQREEHQKNKHNLQRQIGLYYQSLLLLQGIQVAPVILKLNQFSKYRRNNTRWYSTSFYTHCEGYKLCVCVMPRGNIATDEGRFVSVFIAVMQGPHDDKLAWPMQGAVRVILLNQLHSTDAEELRQSITLVLADTPLFPFTSTMRVTGNNKASMKTPLGLMSSTVIGTNMFIAMEELKRVTSTCQFLKNDCIFLKAEYFSSINEVGSAVLSASARLNTETINLDSPRFYRTPPQDVPSIWRKHDLDSPHSTRAWPVHHNSPRDDGKDAKIPETDTKL